MTEPEHIRATYNDVHNLIKKSSTEIAEFKPDILIAIGSYTLVYCIVENLS
jgi:uncharacterized protein